MKDTLKVLIAIILLLGNSLLCGAQHSTSDMKHLMGCWSNTENNNWEYGFFEEFAIYQCGFWDYHSVKFNKNKAEVILQKGNELLHLHFKFDSKTDSVCTLTSSEGRKQKMVRIPAYSDFKSKDNTVFADNGYCQDSATVVGYLRNTQVKTPFELSMPNLLTGKDEVYYADLDSLGRFRMTVPIICTAMVSFDGQDDKLRLAGVLQPQDTLFIYYDSVNGDTRFMGSNARVNQEYCNYIQYICDIDRKAYTPYNALIDHDTFLRNNREVYQEEKNVLEAYIASHLSVSDKFVQFAFNDLTMRYARKLMQRRFSLRWNFNREFFGSAFMKEVDLLFRYVPQLLTLSSSTIDFLSDYLDYYNSMDDTGFCSDAIEIVRYLDETKRLSLTPLQREGLIDYEKWESIAFAGRFEKTDSAMIDSLVLPYRAGMLRTYSLLNDSVFLTPLLQEYAPIAEELVEQKRIKDEFLWLHRIEVPLFVKEWKVAKTFYEQIQNQKEALSERSIAFMYTMLSNECLKKIILEQQKKYELLTKQSVQYLESLKKTDHLKDSKDADSLFRQLIEPYKGKIIYLDIWGTWCAPCREEMSHASAIIKEMEGKDIVFMYLANNSPEKSWKNIIKENNLTGPNVVHYNLPNEQQRMLEKRLSIRSYPTYMLIDHEGNVVDMKSPRPSQKELLAAKLEELLIKLKIKN